MKRPVVFRRKQLCFQVIKPIILYSLLKTVFRELLQSEQQAKMCPNCGTELEDADKLSITEFLQILGTSLIEKSLIYSDIITSTEFSCSCDWRCSFLLGYIPFDTGLTFDCWNSLVAMFSTLTEKEHHTIQERRWTMSWKCWFHWAES